MISDQITKTEFVVGILSRDVENIYKAQQLIARRNIYIEGRQLTKRKSQKKGIAVRSGALLRSLDNPDYLIGSNSDGFIVSSGIVLHMRFLDMKKRGNRRIYNRQVWGILYNNTYPDLMFRYGEKIKNTVGDALREAFESKLSTDKKTKYADYGKARGRES